MGMLEGKLLSAVGRCSCLSLSLSLSLSLPSPFLLSLFLSLSSPFPSPSPSNCHAKAPHIFTRAPAAPANAGPDDRMDPPEEGRDRAED